MILLAISLILLMFLLSAAICSAGLDYLIVHWDLPSAMFVFLGVLFHILRWGRPYFTTGIKALIRLPKTGDPAVAEYFRYLTRWTLGVGVAGMIYGGAVSLLLMRQPFVIGSFLAVMLFTFSYAGWLAVMVFWPISARFSAGSEAVSPSKKFQHFPVAVSLLGLAAFFLNRACMAILLICLSTDLDSSQAFPQAEDIDLFLEQAVLKFNPGDFYGDLVNYLHPRIYWDTPSVLIVVVSLWAFRLAAGKLKNRMEWIPVSVLIGVLWSVEGLIIMLCDLDPDKYSSGCMVSLLTAFYGLVATLFFVIGSWRLVRIFFLSIVVVSCTWVLPQVFLVPFAEPEKLPPLWLQGMIYGAYFMVYAAALGVLFRDVLGVVRILEQRFRPLPQDTTPMSSDEEEARKILDSAVGKLQ